MTVSNIQYTYSSKFKLFYWLKAFLSKKEKKFIKSLLVSGTVLSVCLHKISHLNFSKPIIIPIFIDGNMGLGEVRSLAGSNVANKREL